MLFRTVALAAVATAAAQSLPTWPAQYTTAGTIWLPYSNVTETFLTYYDGTNGRQTINYYNGLDLYVYRADLNVTWQVSPQVTTPTCFLTNGSVSLTSFLPDMSQGYVSKGTTTVNGVQVYDWQAQINNNGRISTYDMYVDVNTGAPVRFHMLGYDILLGSHFDEYVFDYLSFSNSSAAPFPNSIFNQPAGMKCGNFPGPGASIVAQGNALVRELMPASPEAHIPAGAKEDPAFTAFMEQYGKVYANDEELANRQSIFTKNRRLIAAHNKKASASGRSLRLAMNPLGDATPEERFMRMGRDRTGKSVRATRLADARLTGESVSNGATGVHPAPATLKDLPQSLDWRGLGAVEPVQDQGICGSCWSHGATAAISGAYFLKYGAMYVFSKQELIDCSWPFGNNGCGGGEDFSGYQWIMQNGGLSTRANYGPYLMQNGRCAARNAGVKPTVVLTGYVNITSGSESAMMSALFTQGPVSISVDASLPTFDFYSDGIYDDPNCANGLDALDHTISAVGYGVDPISGQTFWIVKNSWSTHWGREGFIYIARQGNVCGVTTAATYPLIA